MFNEKQKIALELAMIDLLAKTKEARKKKSAHARALLEIEQGKIANLRARKYDNFWM